jgi:hypothetical protein
MYQVIVHPNRAGFVPQQIQTSVEYSYIGQNYRFCVVVKMALRSLGLKLKIRLSFFSNSQRLSGVFRRILFLYASSSNLPSCFESVDLWT